MENYAAFLHHYHHQQAQYRSSSPTPSASSSHRLSFLRPSNVGGGGVNVSGPLLFNAAAADGGGAGGEAGEAYGVEEDEEKAAATSMTKKKEKKAKKQQRYAFQTRSQVDILDDGYRWRKYGQKAVKNNSFPRSYYRCTHQGCSVKKQVQRLAKDEGIVVTTYEGVHTHSIDRPSDNFEHILRQMQVNYSHI